MLYWEGRRRKTVIPRLKQQSEGQKFSTLLAHKPGLKLWRSLLSWQGAHDKGKPHVGADPVPAKDRRNISTGVWEP